MTAKELSKGLLITIFTLVGISLAMFLLYQLATVFVYLIITILFCMIAQPLQLFLQNKLKFKNTLAVIATLLIFICLFVGFSLLFVPLILQQSQNLSLINIQSLEDSYKLFLQNSSDYFANHNIDIFKLIDNSNFASSLNFAFIPNLINGFVGFIGNFGMGFFSVLFLSFFFLKDKEMIFNGFQSVLPSNQKEKVLVSLQKISNLLTSYFMGLLLQLTIVFILDWIVFLIFGVENAFIIALLCAILNIIPFIGPLLAMIVTVVLMMISGIGSDFSLIFPSIFKVLVGLLIVQLIDNNVNQPVIFSKSTKSHPLEIFLVILSSGILFGIVGMIIAVPLYTVLRVIGKEFFPNNLFIKALTKNM